MNNIGDKIKQKRKELDLTQIELGRKLNVSDRAVSKWEQGEGNPDISIIPDIAKVLGVSLDYLLLGKDEEPSITLDDMDVEKRLSLLIKKDDAKNFKKYNYLTSEYIFRNSLKYGKTIDLNEKIWKEIIEQKAIKIFNLCCNELVKKNTEKVWAAFLVYNFLDDFVKMTIDANRPDVLETIGFRIFAVNDNEATREKKEIPFTRNQYWDYYITNVDTYFIKSETLEYVFKNRDKSPECFDYATTLEFRNTQIGNSYRMEYTYTYLHDDIVNFAIKYKMYDVIEKVLETYKREIRSDIKWLDRYSYNYDEHFVLRNTYLTQSEKIIARFIPFKLSAIECLLKEGQIDLAKKLNDYNKMVIVKTEEIKVDNSTIPYLSESEISRFLKLNSKDLSEDEKIKLTCVNEKIIIPNEIKKLRNLKLVRDILDNNYYHYYEYVFEKINENDLKELLEFFIDNNLNNFAEKLIKANGNYSQLLEDAWTFFNLKPNQCNREKEKLLNVQNKLDVNSYGKTYIDVYSESGKIEDNEIIEYIKFLKEEIYKDIEALVNKELQDKKDAIERAKLAKGLDKAYFDGLITKNGSFTKKEQRLFILDLCSLFDAILKFDYKCEGEDFHERMTYYFNKMIENAPKSRNCDDGWGYMVLDQKYEDEVVIPEKNKIEHLSNIFNRLRIQRNNIAHSESKKVEELNEVELKECLEYVFSVNKEKK